MDEYNSLKMRTRISIKMHEPMRCDKYLSIRIGSNTESHPHETKRILVKLLSKDKLLVELLNEARKESLVIRKSFSAVKCIARLALSERRRENSEAKFQLTARIVTDPSVFPKRIAKILLHRGLKLVNDESTSVDWESLEDMYNMVFDFCLFFGPSIQKAHKDDEDSESEEIKNEDEDSDDEDSESEEIKNEDEDSDDEPVEGYKEYLLSIKKSII